MSTFDSSRLFGGRFKVEYPSTEGDPIVFWIEHPSDPLKTHLLAESGMVDMEKDENGAPVLNNSAGLRAYETYQVLLAEHCIAATENLTGWPSDCCEVAPSGWVRLNKEAVACIPMRVRRTILIDIGNKILESAQVSAEEGNVSTLQPTGDSTKSSGETPKQEPSPDGSHTAANAEIQN